MKKIISLLLTLVMVLSLSTVAFAADEGYFYDISKSKNEEAIEYLYDLGMIEGYGNHNFGPTDNLTRAQACALIVRAMVGDNEIFADYNDTFIDVKYYDWYRDEVDTAYRHGYMNGYGNGYFGPTDKVTYAQFATIITNVLGYDATKLSGTWPRNVIDIASKNGLFKNITKNVLTTDTITREDAAQMIYNALDCNMVTFVNGEFKTTTALLRSVIDSNYSYEVSGVIAHVIQEPSIMNRFIAHFWMIDEDNNMIEVYATAASTIHIGDKVVVSFDHADRAEIVDVEYPEIVNYVWINKDGEHYHYNENCTYLIKNIENMIKVTEANAIWLGYVDECRICSKD